MNWVFFAWVVWFVVSVLWLRFLCWDSDRHVSLIRQGPAHWAADVAKRRALQKQQQRLATILDLRRSLRVLSPWEMFHLVSLVGSWVPLSGFRVLCWVLGSCLLGMAGPRG